MKNGFSLIELMIVLTVTAILITIAVPSYQAYLNKTYRLQAQTDLYDLASHLQDYYLQHDSYLKAPVPKTHSANRRYQLSIIKRDAEHFTVMAHAKSAKTTQHCQELTLNEQGERGPNVSCWQ